MNERTSGSDALVWGSVFLKTVVLYGEREKGIISHCDDQFDAKSIYLARGK